MEIGKPGDRLYELTECRYQHFFLLGNGVVRVVDGCSAELSCSIHSGTTQFGAREKDCPPTHLGMDRLQTRTGPLWCPWSCSVGAILNGSYLGGGVISALERLGSPPPLGNSQCEPPPEPGKSWGALSPQPASFLLWRDLAPSGSAGHPHSTP